MYKLISAAKHGATSVSLQRLEEKKKMYKGQQPPPVKVSIFSRHIINSPASAIKTAKNINLRLCPNNIHYAASQHHRPLFLGFDQPRSRFTSQRNRGHRYHGYVPSTNLLQQIPQTNQDTSEVGFHRYIFLPCQSCSSVLSRTDNSAVS